MTPLEPSEAMQTLELGYVNAGFIAFAALLLLTLVLGRFFCGWACHVVAYQDACAWLLGKLRLRPRPLRARVLKLVPLAVALYMFAWPTAKRWWQDAPAPAWTAHLTTDSFWRTFPGPWMAALTIAIDGALIVWWLGAKGFCTYGCPYGALFGLADRFAVGRIRVTDACEGCGHCTAVCTSNVRVHQEVATFGMVVDAGCMKCLDCVSSCPKEALYFGAGRPSLLAGFKSAAATRAGGADLTWSEEILAAVVWIASVVIFRDLYSKVPFLLAVGLASIAAIAAVAGKRLLARADLQVQWTAWRASGRLTRGGRIAAIAVALFFAFLLHSAVVHFFTWQGKRSMEQWLANTQDRAPLHAAEQPLATALRLGLFPDAVTQSALAAVYDRTGRPEQALPHLRRALELEPSATQFVALAGIEARGGRREAAIAALRQALALAPDHPEATRRLRELGGDEGRR